MLSWEFDAAGASPYRSGAMLPGFEKNRKLAAPGGR
jgi:hypothetical protein